MGFHRKKRTSEKVDFVGLVGLGDTATAIDSQKIYSFWGYLGLLKEMSRSNIGIPREKRLVTHLKNSPKLPLLHLYRIET